MVQTHTHTHTRGEGWVVKKDLSTSVTVINSVIVTATADETEYS